MASSDIELTFDPKMLEAGLKAIVGKLAGLESQFVKVAASTTHMEKSGAKSIGLWTAIMGKGMQILTGAFNRMMSFVPEIGKTFQIAGDIIGRNLLWPLRQQLIPLLQKFLNWVRDHRAMFVRWGMVIANVFRVLWKVVQGFWEMFKKMWERVSAGLKKVFGNSVKSFTELLNVLLFKAAVVVMTIQQLLEPVLEFLVDAWINIARIAKSFFEGVIRGASGIVGPLSQIWDVLKELGQMFLEFTGDSGIIDFFGTLGSIIGNTLYFALEGVVSLLEGFVYLLKAAALAARFLTKDLSFEELKTKMGELNTDTAGRYKKIYNRVEKKASDIMGGSEEQVESLHPAENVKVEAVKPNAKDKASTVNNNYTQNVQVKVEGGKASAEDIANRTADKIKKSETLMKGSNVKKQASPFQLQTGVVGL